MAHVARHQNRFIYGPFAMSRKGMKSQPLASGATGAAIYAPAPEYPPAARRLGWTGAGIFASNLRPDGVVCLVNVLKSASHQILDQARIVFRQWRLKVRGVKVVRIPLRFVLPRSRRLER